VASTPASGPGQARYKGSAVVFFYGADDAPSCSKQIAAFDGAAAEFAAAGVAVVGVRNAAGVKAGGPSAFRLVVDEGDAMRTEFGIAKDFFVLGGRETYVLDAAGSIVAVHNNQFDPESHVAVARAAVNALPKAKTGGSPFDGLFGKK